MHEIYNPIVLANTQKTIGLIIVVLLMAAFAIAILVNMRKGRAEVGSEIELAANRKPYMDDEELETKKLDRTLGLGLVALAVIGIALPLYWLAEPGRQMDATKGVAKRSTPSGPSAAPVTVPKVLAASPITRSPIPPPATSSPRSSGRLRR